MFTSLFIIFIMFTSFFIILGERPTCLHTPPKCDSNVACVRNCRVNSFVACLCDEFLELVCLHTGGAFDTISTKFNSSQLSPFDAIQCHSSQFQFNVSSLQFGSVRLTSSQLKSHQFDQIRHWLHGLAMSFWSYVVSMLEAFWHDFSTIQCKSIQRIQVNSMSIKCQFK